MKLRIRKARSGAWLDCKDFRQAAAYGRSLGCPVILMDVISVHLFPPGANRPSLTMHRRDFTQADLEAVRAHLLGQGSHAELVA